MPNMSQRVRVGVIGVGFGQHVHVPAFRADPRATVASICASTSDRARVVADRLAIPRYHGDWRDLVNDPEIDALSIAVPAALQAEVVQAAAARGKHVFCEKPLAMNAAQARAMLDSAREMRIANAVDFEFVELPAWHEARRVCASGTLGRLRHIVISWRVETMAYRQSPSNPSWKLNADGGGGALNLFVSHCLHYVEWLFAPIERLAARLAPEGATADARVDAWLELADGTPVTLSVAADAYLGSGHAVEVYGDQGTLLLENRSADYAKGFTLSLGTRSTTSLTPVTLAGGEPEGDGRVAAVASLVKRFIDAVLVPQERAAFQPGLEAGYRVQVLIDAIRVAHRSGRWQSLGNQS